MKSAFFIVLMRNVESLRKRKLLPYFTSVQLHNYLFVDYFFVLFFLTFAQVVNRQNFIDTYTNNVVMFAEREILFNCEHSEQRVGLVITVISAALISVVLLMYSKACIWCWILKQLINNCYMISVKRRMVKSVVLPTCFPVHLRASGRPIIWRHQTSIGLPIGRGIQSKIVYWKITIMRRGSIHIKRLAQNMHLGHVVDPRHAENYARWIWVPS